MTGTPSLTAPRLPPIFHSEYRRSPHSQMPMALSYCDIAPGHPEHGPYHDREYGFPLAGDDALFERLVLEINQAGLSWLTILKKREAFREAFRGFEIARVARFKDRDRQRLMANEG